MTHDPLCPWMGYTRVPDDACWQCDLIAKVREDQDRRHAAAELTRDAQDMGMIP